MTILVVDDELSYVELLSDIFAQQSFRTISAADGKQAIAMLRSIHVDVIVSDIEMSGMNGIAFHESIQSDAKLRAIPFYFVTGSDNPAYRAYADRFPSTGFVSKMQVMESLVPMLVELQSRRSVRTAL